MINSEELSFVPSAEGEAEDVTLAPLALVKKSVGLQMEEAIAAGKRVLLAAKFAKDESESALENIVVIVNGYKIANCRLAALP